MRRTLNRLALAITAMVALAAASNRMAAASEMTVPMSVRSSNARMTALKTASVPQDCFFNASLAS